MMPTRFQTYWQTTKRQSIIYCIFYFVLSIQNIQNQRSEFSSHFRKDVFLSCVCFLAKILFFSTFSAFTAYSILAKKHPLSKESVFSYQILIAGYKMNKFNLIIYFLISATTSSGISNVTTPIYIGATSPSLKLMTILPFSLM